MDVTAGISSVSLCDLSICVGWAVVWAVSNAASRAWFYPSRCSICYKEKQVAEHLVGLVHAVVSTAVALSVVSDPEMTDVVYSRSEVWAWGWPITMGYILYDSVLISQAVWQYAHEFSPGEQKLHKQYMVHHAFILAAGFYKIFWQPPAGDFAGSIFLLLEATNIPHDIRQIATNAHRTDRKWLSLSDDSPAMLVLGVCFLVMYVLCRFGTIIWMFWLLAAQRGVPMLQVLSVVPYKCIIGTSMILALNLYWLTFIVAKVRKRVCGKKTDIRPPKKDD